MHARPVKQERRLLVVPPKTQIARSSRRQAPHARLINVMLLRVGWSAGGLQLALADLREQLLTGCALRAPALPLPAWLQPVLQRFLCLPPKCPSRQCHCAAAPMHACAHGSRATFGQHMHSRAPMSAAAASGKASGETTCFFSCGSAMSRTQF